MKRMVFKLWIIMLFVAILFTVLHIVDVHILPEKTVNIVFTVYCASVVLFTYFAAYSCHCKEKGMRPSFRSLKKYMFNA